MDDEHERQQRDLQRATTLLETMPREDMADMLLDILSNERSDDTRKLADWMAFQIILHEDTRRERELLAQLGKDGKNHRRLQITEVSNAIDINHASSGQELEQQEDDEEEDSSSTASFVTCPNSEALSPSLSGSEAAHHNTDDHISLAYIRRWDDKVSRHNLRPFTPSSRQKKSHHSEASCEVWPWGKSVPTLEKTNELGYTNLAELYARYDKVQEERKDVYHGYEDHEKETRTSDVPASDQASEDTVKMQCRFCSLYYASEQNLRDIDDGRSPCSFHPGQVERGGAIGPTATDSRFAWTCCHSIVSDDEYEAGPAQSPGCVNIYHSEMKKLWCHTCGRPFTKESNDVQPDGSSPCSYHPGWPAPDEKKGQIWTCCQEQTNSKGPLWDLAVDPTSPGCEAVYHQTRRESRKWGSGIWLKPRPFP